MDTYYFSAYTTYIPVQSSGSSISLLLPQRIGSKYWYKVMMILLLCMVNESWCLDVCIRYKIHIPYRKRKKDRHWANTGGRGLLLGIYAFVQLLCKVVRLLIMMLENQDAVLTILLLNTTKDEHPPPPAVFLYLSIILNKCSKKYSEGCRGILERSGCTFRCTYSAEKCGFPQKFDRYLIHCILWAYYYQRLGNNTIWILKLQILQTSRTSCTIFVFSSSTHHWIY